MKSILFGLSFLLFDLNSFASADSTQIFRCMNGINDVTILSDWNRIKNEVGKDLILVLGAKELIENKQNGRVEIKVGKVSAHPQASDFTVYGGNLGWKMDRPFIMTENGHSLLLGQLGVLAGSTTTLPGLTAGYPSCISVGQ